MNTKKLKDEFIRKQLVEDDFMQFKKGINPNLLFECFEALIVLIGKKSDKVDDLIDHLALIYRYILSKKNKQLVLINEELNTLDELVQLFNYLPFRNVSINKQVDSSFLVVPGSLLALIETIIRSTIATSDLPFQINIIESENHLTLSYYKSDKIIAGFNSSSLNDIDELYTIYSNDELSIKDLDEQRIISIPKLITKANL